MKSSKKSFASAKELNETFMNVSSPPLPKFRRFFNKIPFTPQPHSDVVITVPDQGTNLEDLKKLTNVNTLRKYDNILNDPEFNLDDVFDQQDVALLDPIEVELLRRKIKADITRRVTDFQQRQNRLIKEALTSNEGNSTTKPNSSKSSEENAGTNSK